MTSSLAFCAVVLAAIAVCVFCTDCLSCICYHESGCKPLGCKQDNGTLSCGYFQIKEPYYIDAGQPGKRHGESTEVAWKRCADDFQCAATCVQNYVRRYASNCGGVGKCQRISRLHNGGPHGCNETATLGYWRVIENCCRCS